MDTASDAPVGAPEAPTPRPAAVASSSAPSPRRERRGAPARRAAPRRGPGGLLVLAAAGAGAAALWAAVRRRGAHRARAARRARIEACILKGVVVHTGFKRERGAAWVGRRPPSDAPRDGSAEAADRRERAVVSTSLARRLADGSALLHPAAGSVSERFREAPVLARLDATTPWRERVDGRGSGSGAARRASAGPPPSPASPPFALAGPETAVARAVAEGLGEVGLGAESAGSPGLVAAQALGLAYARVPLSRRRAAGAAGAAGGGAPSSIFALVRDAAILPLTVGAALAGDAAEDLSRAANASGPAAEPSSPSPAAVLPLPPLPAAARAPSSLVTYLIATDAFHALGGGARESELQTLAAVMAWAGREMTKTIALTDFLQAHVQGLMGATRDLAVERIKAQVAIDKAEGERSAKDANDGSDGVKPPQADGAGQTQVPTGLSPGDVAPTSGPPLRGAAPSRATPTEVLLTLLTLREAALAAQGDEEDGEEEGGEDGEGKENGAGAEDKGAAGSESVAGRPAASDAPVPPSSPLWRPSKELRTRLRAVARSAKVVLSKALGEGHVIVLPGAPGRAPLEGEEDGGPGARPPGAPALSPPLFRHVRFGQALGALATISDAAAVALPGLPQGSPGPVLLAAPARLPELCRAAAKLEANLRAVEDLELPKAVARGRDVVQSRAADGAARGEEAGADGADERPLPPGATGTSGVPPAAAEPGDGRSTAAAAAAAAEVVARSGGEAARRGMLDRAKDGAVGGGAAPAASSAAASLRQEGNALFKAGDAAGAELAYSRALELEPSSAVLFSNRALVRLQLGRFSDAVADCDASLQLEATPKALLRRAAALRALGDVETAMLDLKRVLALEPKNAQARRELKELKAVGRIGLAL